MKDIVLFDLDNTLLGGDSDESWGNWLVEKKIVDAESYGRENARFYQDYLNGSLDIYAFLRFQLHILTQHPLESLYEWRKQFIEDKIKPLLLPKAHTLIAQHRAQGAELAIITATNRFITEPIAALYGIQHLIATEPAWKNGAYSGELQGTPCFAEGKITRFQEWRHSMKLHEDTQEVWFYSDSHNDIPLLSRVTHPTAVDPDDKLRGIAEQRGWPVISLRGDAFLD